MEVKEKWTRRVSDTLQDPHQGITVGNPFTQNINLFHRNLVESLLSKEMEVKEKWTRRVSDTLQVHPPGITTAGSNPF
jgi:hypothetical protein